MTTLRSPVVVVGTLIGVVIGGAELIGGGATWRVVVSAAIPIAYAVIVTLVGRRSETVSVLAGRPVDERWQHMNLEASTLAFGVTAIVALAAFVSAQATRGEWQPYALMCAVMAIAYMGSLILLRLRG